MNLRALGRGEVWMTDEERLAMKQFIGGMRRMFAARKVEESPLLTLRVADVGIHWLLARRLERGLILDRDDSGDRPVEFSGSLADQIGKARERMRKAVRELEDACARLGAPIDVGIADNMLPMVRKTSDLLHDSRVHATHDEHGETDAPNPEESQVT